MTSKADHVNKQNSYGVTGVVLAGGISRRMGQDKALLVWRGETLLARTVRCLSELCDDIIVVGPRRDVPLPENARFAQDILPGVGPLGGLYTGLSEARSDSVLVLACDLPFAQPDALQCLLDLLYGVAGGQRATYRPSEQSGTALETRDCKAPHDRAAETPIVRGVLGGATLPVGCGTKARRAPKFDAVVPVWQGRSHPLHAVYRRSAVHVAAAHLRRGQHRIDQFCSDLNSLYAGAASFASVDPEMKSLTNINTIQEYRSALELVTVNRPLNQT